MRFTSNRLLAAACGLLLLSAPAFGNPLRDRPAADAPRSAAGPRPVFGPSALVAEARKYIGTNPTDRKRLWCARFMNFILAKVGYVGTHSDAARSFAHYGRRISQPRVGAIAVLRRGKRGGHVGVVAGIDAHGNPIIISGNHNRRVGVGVYPRSRVIAYVIPTERRDASAESVPDKTIESPIAELFAAIANEHERGSPANRALPLDPSLAELFGLDQGNAAESPLSRPPS